MTWIKIISRCFSETNDSYENYGGRGITICHEWRHDFVAFHEYVTQLPHYGQDGYTLDRINNDGNYEPGNLRWATRAEQNRNKRNIRMLTARGETKCLAEWAREIGMSEHTLARRLKGGLSIEDLVNKS